MTEDVVADLGQVPHSESSRTLRWSTLRHPKGRPPSGMSNRPRKTSIGSSLRSLGKRSSKPLDIEENGQSMERNNNIQRPKQNGRTSGARMDADHHRNSSYYDDKQETDDQRDVVGEEAAEELRGNTKPKEKRTIYFNLPLPKELRHDDGRPRHHFTRNKIRTAKYTPLSFLPKNLYLQFHTVANIYFFFIVILQIFPIFGASNPGLGSVPLIVILTVTAFKDAMEDWRRTVLDNELNNTLTRTLHDWHNVNVVDEKVSLWRAFKKRVSHSIQRAHDKRKIKKGEKIPEYELERSNTVVRLSTQTNRSELFADNDYRLSLKLGAKDPNGASLEAQIRNAAIYGNDASRVDSNASSNYTDAIAPEVKPLDPHSRKGTGSIINPFKQTPETAKFRRTYWKNVRVGDFVLLRNDDPIPADVVILATSDADGACFVETKNLDGETNLKVRHALRCGSAIKSSLDCEAASFWIESEPPTANLYSYSALARWETKNPDFPKENASFSEPISIDSLLLRGCNLKNTKWVIGVVVFTGKETKIMMNSGITPSKRSRITRNLNSYVRMMHNVFALTIPGHH